MTPRPLIRFALMTASLAGLAVTGCDGGTNLAVTDGGAADRPRGNLGDASSARPEGGRELGSFEALPDRPPPPPPSMESLALAPGRSRLIGTHVSACTNGVPATGDRWCAFTKPNAKIGNTDLWVINVTKAFASGAAPACNGMDPNCKLLIPPGVLPADGTKLWTGQPMEGPSHPTTHRFDGDTLIFHANADPNVDIYAGPIFAWRPGWAEPKKISMGDAAYSCSGHFASESYVCFENLSTTMPLTFDLTAAKLGMPPQVVKKIVPGRPGGMSSQWRAAISRDGSSLIYSTGGTTLMEPETIYVAKFDAPAASTMVKMRASRWSLSTDGTKVYYLGNFNYDPMMPAGTLTMADFPSGNGEVAIAPNVAAMSPLAEGEIDRGLGFFDGIVAGKATYKMMKNKAMPTQITTIITNIGGVLGVSRDQRFVYFFRDVNPDTGATTDGYIVKTDGTGTPCNLTTTLDSDQFGTPFTRNGSMVFWADNIDPVDGVGEGWVANPDGCTGRKKFSERIDFWFLHGDNGMVLSDEGFQDFATLKYLPFAGGNSLGTMTTIQQQVNRIYGLVLPNYDGVIYNIQGAAADKDGLYSFSKIPFAGPTGGGGSPDAGAPPRDGPRGN